MANAPTYTPYASATKPFAIGLSALDPDHWLEPDGDLEDFLSDKDRLLTDHRDDVFREDIASRAAQSEALDLILAHLFDRHQQFYSRHGDKVQVGEREVDLGADLPPLLAAGSLIPDDLAILEKRDGEWSLTAGYVAFPSGWSLKDKAGLPMTGVHAHVPGFEGGTRNAMMLERIFDNLQPDLPAVRFNWSIYPSGELFWPPERGARAETQAFTPAQNFIRVERQTLRRLPKTGAIVFTIRIYADPIGRLRQEGGDLAAALAGKLMDMNDEQLGYKGMRSKRDSLVAYLTAQTA